MYPLQRDMRGHLSNDTGIMAVFIKAGIRGMCADIPLEWVDIRCAAQNQAVKGILVRCITVPAVTEVWRPQAAHS